MATVKFEEGRNGGVITRWQGKVAFPDRSGPKPQVGEEWEVEQATPHKSVFFLKLSRKFVGKLGNYTAQVGKHPIHINVTEVAEIHPWISAKVSLDLPEGLSVAISTSLSTLLPEWTRVDDPSDITLVEERYVALFQDGKLLEVFWLGKDFQVWEVKYGLYRGGTYLEQKGLKIVPELDEQGRRKVECMYEADIYGELKEYGYVPLPGCRHIAVTRDGHDHHFGYSTPAFRSFLAEVRDGKYTAQEKQS